MKQAIIALVVSCLLLTGGCKKADKPQPQPAAPTDSQPQPIAEPVAAPKADNTPPQGFIALFNGQDLTGWKGLVADPPTRAKMTAEELSKAQVEADEVMRTHWKVVDGTLEFDGHGSHLCTVKDYADFEMFVDWKIEAGGDSGIYLRGSPQVQIWDTALTNVGAQVGSGGFYNNQKNPSQPLKVADNPVGQWNTFRILMIGDRVTVHLNDQLVVDNTVMENYWERDKPMYSSGQIELQSHGTKLYFKNIYIREIPREAKSLFNGQDLSGWEQVGGEPGAWQVADGTLYNEGNSGGWLSTVDQYTNFKLELEFMVPPGGNSGVFIRTPREGNPAYAGSEIQVLDDYADQYKDLKPWQFCGSVYSVQAPSQRVTKPANEWQKMAIECVGVNVKVTLNDTQIIDVNLNDHFDKIAEHPGLQRTGGYIGFQHHGEKGLKYRNIRITEL